MANNDNLTSIPCLAWPVSSNSSSSCSFDFIVGKINLQKNGLVSHLIEEIISKSDCWQLEVCLAYFLQICRLDNRLPVYDIGLDKCVTSKRSVAENNNSECLYGALS